MDYIYEDLLDSNFIKPPYSSIFIDNDIDEKVINQNVLLFTNSIYTLKLCLHEDISFTSNQLCVILIDQLSLKNDFSKYSTSLLNFFQETQDFNPLKTRATFYFIPGIEKISYEILFLSR